MAASGIDSAMGMHRGVAIKLDLGPNQAVVELARLDLKSLHIAGDSFGLRVRRREVENHLKCTHRLPIRWVPNQDDEVGGDGDRYRRWCWCRELDTGQVDPSGGSRNGSQLDVIHEKGGNDLHTWTISVQHHPMHGTADPSPSAYAKARIEGFQLSFEPGMRRACVEATEYCLSVAAHTTRDSILSEARHCFANQGFEGTSLNDIAEAVGVRRPSLLHHFASKEAIYQQVLQDALLDWGQRIDTALDAESHDPWIRVDSILDASFEFFRHNPDVVRIVRREALTDKGHLEVDLGVALRPYFEQAVAFFRRQMDLGTFRNQDPEHLVITGYGALLTYFSDHMMLVGLLNRDPLSDTALDQRLEHMRHFVRSALEPTEQTGGSSALAAVSPSGTAPGLPVG